VHGQSVPGDYFLKQSLDTSFEFCKSKLFVNYKRLPGRETGIFIYMKHFKIILGYGAGTGNSRESFCRLSNHLTPFLFFGGIYE